MTLLLTFLMSLASGAGHQASSAIASKHCFSVKNKPTITFCSNATECVHFIKFWSDNHVPWTKHHPNCYSRWYCEVRWKFVATTRVFPKKVFHQGTFYYTKTLLISWQRFVINGVNDWALEAYSQTIIS